MNFWNKSKLGKASIGYEVTAGSQHITIIVFSKPLSRFVSSAFFNVTKSFQNLSLE